MAITIRPITQADAAAFNAAVGLVASEKKYLVLTERPPLEGSIAYVTRMIVNGFPLLVAFDGDALVGWCDVAGTDRPATAHVGTLGIGLLLSHRERGLGERLMRAAIEAGQKRGFTRIQLGVLKGNDRALALYRKLGFVNEGERRKYLLIDGVYIDEIMMALLL